MERKGEGRERTMQREREERKMGGRGREREREREREGEGEDDVGGGNGKRGKNSYNMILCTSQYSLHTPLPKHIYTYSILHTCSCDLLHQKYLLSRWHTPRDQGRNHHRWTGPWCSPAGRKVPLQQPQHCTSCQ